MGVIWLFSHLPGIGVPSSFKVRRNSLMLVKARSVHSILTISSDWPLRVYPIALSYCERSWFCVHLVLILAVHSKNALIHCVGHLECDFLGPNRLRFSIGRLTGYLCTLVAKCDPYIPWIHSRLVFPSSNQTLNWQLCNIQSGILPDITTCPTVRWGLVQIVWNLRACLLGLKW